MIKGKATITFHPQYIVAVFQDISKFNLQSDVYDYLSGIPDNILEIAKSETLQYVLNDIDGKRKPIITAAFWGTWRELFSNQLWNEIRNNGGLCFFYLVSYTLGNIINLFLQVCTNFLHACNLFFCC